MFQNYTALNCLNDFIVIKSKKKIFFQFWIEQKQKCNDWTVLKPCLFYLEDFPVKIFHMLLTWHSKKRYAFFTWGKVINKTVTMYKGKPACFNFCN